MSKPLMWIRSADGPLRLRGRNSTTRVKVKEPLLRRRTQSRKLIDHIEDPWQKLQSKPEPRIPDDIEI
jgi:hypothetical protein